MGGVLHPGTVRNYLTLVNFRAKRQCLAMDDDSLDELVDRSPGPDGRSRLNPAVLASSAGEQVPHFSPGGGPTGVGAGVGGLLVSRLLALGKAGVPSGGLFTGVNFNSQSLLKSYSLLLSWLVIHFICVGIDASGEECAFPASVPFQPTFPSPTWAAMLWLVPGAPPCSSEPALAFCCLDCVTLPLGLCLRLFRLRRQR